MLVCSWWSGISLPTGSDTLVSGSRMTHHLARSTQFILLTACHACYQARKHFEVLTHYYSGEQKSFLLLAFQPPPHSDQLTYLNILSEATCAAYVGLFLCFICYYRIQDLFKIHSFARIILHHIKYIKVFLLSLNILFLPSNRPCRIHLLIT